MIRTDYVLAELTARSLLAFVDVLAFIRFIRVEFVTWRACAFVPDGFIDANIRTRIEF